MDWVLNACALEVTNKNVSTTMVFLWLWWTTHPASPPKSTQQVMARHARFSQSQATQLAKQPHQQLTAAWFGAMSTLASAMAPQTFQNQTTSPLPSIQNHYTTRLKHVAQTMHTLPQSVLESQPKPRAMLKMNALTQQEHAA
jgi:hypothetical protein